MRQKADKPIPDWQRSLVYWRKAALPEWWQAHWPYALIRTLRGQIAEAMAAVKYWKRRAEHPRP